MRPGARAAAGLLGAALAGLACAGPLGPLPGGRLEGTLEAEPPEDWTFTRDVRLIQLETRPGDPYSVNLGCVDHAGSIYVGTDHPQRARWVKHIQADPRVRLRVGDRIWERRAVRVTDTDEWTLAGLALFRKYDLEYEEGETDEHGWLFRLDPR